MRTRAILFGVLAATGIAASPAAASIIDDFNAATLVTDFQFDDDLGTAIEATANSADPAAPFDSDADFGGAATNGLGQYDGSGKANTSFGSAYTDLAPINSGRVIALFDVTWSFDESVFDSGQDEEFRLSLIANDPRSTFITAEINFTRSSATAVELFGNGVGTGGVDTSTVTLPSSGSLLTMLDVDIDTRVFELFYSDDDGVTFLSAGTGLTGDFDSGTPEIDIRGVESARLVLNEDFSDDTLLIERFAVATIPEPATGLVVTACGSLLVALQRRYRC